ncbi:MAG: tetratricopeptide repeat protein, partial [Bacteroidetes bacterium]
MRNLLLQLLYKTLTIGLFGVFFLIAAGVQGQHQQVLSQTVLDRIERLEELVEYYVNREDPSLAASYLTQISYLYWENQRLEKAAENFHRAAPYFEKLNDLVNLQNLYSNIGLIYLDLEDIARADRAFASNLEVCRRMGEPQGIATALVDLAYVKNLGNDHREAIRLLEDAQKIALEINYESILSNIYRQLATSYTNIGNIRKGEEFRQKYNDIREHFSRQTMRGEFQEREQQSQLEILRQQAEARVSVLEMEKNRIQFQLEQDSISAIVRAKEDSLLQARRVERIQRQDIELLENRAQLNQTENERLQAVQNFQQLVIYSVLGGLAL